MPSHPPLAYRKAIPYLLYGRAFRLDNTRTLEVSMQYRTLGGTGIKVSPYALGALMLGASIGNADHEDSARIIHKALDAGVNLIDTADGYSTGESEVVVGEALKGRQIGRASLKKRE